MVNGECCPCCPCCPCRPWVLLNQHWPQAKRLLFFSGIEPHEQIHLRHRRRSLFLGEGRHGRLHRPAPQEAGYRIRRPKEARSEKNSLQLEVSVSADSYLTIVDVDSEGGVNLLFPNNYQERSFVADGLVHAGETILIPDSLKSGNRAGFYWDYTPPKGTDTVRVFTSTDVQTAQMLRQRVQTLQTTTSQTSGGVKTRGVAAGIGTIRQDLAKIATRGIVTVYDPTSHVPGSPIVDQPEPSSVTSAPTAPAAVTPPAPASEPAVPTSPAADWAATSVTILVEG